MTNLLLHKNKKRTSICCVLACMAHLKCSMRIKA